LLRNFFVQLPIELEEAALVDGATRLQALRKVVVPVAVPAVFTAAILSFILAWNDFTFAVSFLVTPSHFTAPLSIVTFGQSQYQVFYNRIDAAVVIISIPIALLVLFLQRRIVAGLTAGSFR
jgi:ABC-type glycerol-3-phosphate transport system permease component